MQKYVVFLGIFLWVSAAMAEECVGGTWVTANSVANNPDICTEATCNGATFCKSSGKMNWWSAFTWCASNGLHLATFQEMCPGISVHTNSGCPNLENRGNGWVWSSLGNEEKYAFHIYLPSGSMNGTDPRNVNYSAAFCK